MAGKHIVVVTQFIDNDYNTDIINGIKNYYKDADVFFLEVRDQADSSAAFGYQYWAAITLARAKHIDGIIIITGTFCTKFSLEEIRKIFQPYFTGVPVVSVSVDIPFENSYATQVDCLSGYREIISHLIDVHNKKRIAFVSANLTSSVEGFARFEAYKTALKEKGIPFDPSLVIDSDFLTSTTRKIFDEKYPAKESVNFDAIICANDLMAFGAIYSLQKLGLNVPGDIAVVGYDDCSAAASFIPSLTSLNQQLVNQGYTAAKVLDNAIAGKKQPRITDVAIKPIYRRSCGCKNLRKKLDKQTEAARYVDYDSSFVHLNSLLEKVQYSQTLSEIYNLFYRILTEVSVDAFAICLYDKPILISNDEKFSLPEKVKLAMAFDRTWGFQSLNDNRIFNPHETIIPDGILNPEGGSYFVRTIFYGEKQYGYLLYKPGAKPNLLYNIYFKVITNAIANAYEYYESLTENIDLILKNKELLQDNTQLNIESQTDELTKVLNRRGFLNLGQKAINLALQQNLTGLVIFGDMDGLKKINDNFGHDAGDIAIQAEAKILSKVFRTTDVIGRMGGDEFAIVTSGMSLDFLKKVQAEIEICCENWSKESDIPFKLSISLGAVVFDKTHFILQDLLGDADKKQYEVKRQKHAERK